MGLTQVWFVSCIFISFTRHCQSWQVAKIYLVSSLISLIFFQWLKGRCSLWMLHFYNMFLLGYSIFQGSCVMSLNQDFMATPSLTSPVAFDA